MDRVRLPGTDIEVSALCLGVAEIGVRQTEIEAHHLLDYCVVAQPNSGLGAARNAGIRLAKGEFILPLDSDNRVRDAYLNEAASLLKDNPSLDVIYADAEYFGDRNGRWQIPEFDLLSLIRMNFIDACALYRKSLWEKVGGYDEHMPSMGVEDWDFGCAWPFMEARFSTFLRSDLITVCGATR